MRIRRQLLAATWLCIVALATNACTLSLFRVPQLPALPTQLPASPIPAPDELPKAQTVFVAELSAPLASGESLALGLLDEVTGLALNAQLYPMRQVDGVTYTATLALPYLSVVKYHYVRLGAAQYPEDTSSDGIIRYRLYFASGPGEVRDRIASWSDGHTDYGTGSIQGRVLNSDTGLPIPDILVTAGGERAFTDSGGRFEIQGLIPGTHNFVAYALDGTFATFQQGATVASGLTTAVEAKLKAAPLVNVTFSVAAPNDVQGAPVRIAGNLLELGNTFSDLLGGVSTVAERMPVMSFQPDGRYSATISLPAGAYVQYKYTLGDGFWNAEHNGDGSFRLRELVVPAQDAVIQDAIDTWRAGNSAPILFEANVTPDTPAADLISIQFNPFGWTEPIPMWPMGNNRWLYKLYSPLNTLGKMQYRYCRSGQCGSADDLSTAGSDAQGRAVDTSLSEQDIKDSISDWAWLQDSEPSTLVGSSITPRAEGFVAGVEFASEYRPNWSYYNAQAVQDVQALGAGWVVFTPGWTFRSSDRLDFGLSPDHDPFWLDSAVMISQARATNLNVAIFPSPRFETNASDFWGTDSHDTGWWQNWFDHYRAFAVNYADLAAQTGSQALILGGDWIDPALPRAALVDGSPTGAPADSEARWQAILAEVRQHYGGKVWWALPYTPGRLATSLNFLSGVDGIYLLWNAPLASTASDTVTDMANQAGQLLDNEISPLGSVLMKPVILAIAYPSAAGAATGCVDDGQGGCLYWRALSQPENPASATVDLQTQANAYEAMLNAINGRSYIAGVVSRGYYPPTLLQDKSASVHGKPAADLLWYWFPRLTGIVK